MQARPVRPSRLLGHHLMQAPDDGPLRRRPQRHAQPESVDRRRVGGDGGIKIMQNTRSQWRKGFVASRAHAYADATTAGPIQGLQASLQRRQSVSLRINVPHMFYMRANPLGESSEAGDKARNGHRQRPILAFGWPHSPLRRRANAGVSEASSRTPAPIASSAGKNTTPKF